VGENARYYVAFKVWEGECGILARSNRAGHHDGVRERRRYRIQQIKTKAQDDLYEATQVKEHMAVGSEKKQNGTMQVKAMAGSDKMLPEAHERGSQGFLCSDKSRTHPSGI
jgi:hypothetical protein